MLSTPLIWLHASSRCHRILSSVVGEDPQDDALHALTFEMLVDWKCGNCASVASASASVSGTSTVHCPVLLANTGLVDDTDNDDDDVGISLSALIQAAIEDPGSHSDLRSLCGQCPTCSSERDVVSAHVVRVPETAVFGILHRRAQVREESGSGRSSVDEVQRKVCTPSHALQEKRGRGRGHC
jgi:hypothetical protein